VCITTNQPDTKSNPNPNPNPNPTTEHTRSSKRATNYSHMPHVSTEIHARQCCCTVFITFRCHRTSAVTFGRRHFVIISIQPFHCQLCPAYLCDVAHPVTTCSSHCLVHSSTNITHAPSPFPQPASNSPTELTFSISGPTANWNSAYFSIHIRQLTETAVFKRKLKCHYLNWH